METDKNAQGLGERDHRRLGQELDLFVFSDLVGSGLPLFTPKGTILRDELIKLSEELQQKHGFQKVWIPHIAKTDLYKKSGHWDKFGNELFLVKSQETDDQFVLKPMSCPHHAQIFAARPRSYRDLPIRLMETTTCYRDEKSGELLGLTRVRSFNQDDAHVFCTMEQVAGEFTAIMSMIKEMYRALGLAFKARLSFHDPANKAKYLGEPAQWAEGEKVLQNIADKLKLEYSVGVGEAAFYGPKIDILVIDSLSREWQCATEQLDFVQPVRLGLEYTDTDGQKKTPVMIHKALLGSVERFLSIYLEHTAGVFPLWLAPVQVKILPISDKHHDYAKQIAHELKKNKVRVELDESNETLGKKIRQGKVEKIPYLVVLGDQEVTNQTLTIESHDDGKSESNLADFVAKLQAEIKNRS